jgi:AAA domain-containing protein
MTVDVTAALDDLRTAARQALERGDADDPLGKWRQATEDERDDLVERWVEQQIFTAKRAAELGFPGMASMLADQVQKLSAEPSPGTGRKSELRFTSARELAETTPPDVDWALRGYVPFGALVELSGRPKAGKSTLLALGIAAIVDGRPFLDRPTMKTPVVVLTEQPPTSLRQLLERAGLTDRDDVRLLLWRDARGVPWSSIVAAAVDECHRIGARMLVVDTLHRFASMRGDTENDAGAALEALEPLQAAADGGLAVVIIRHERKSGAADVADAGRGSGAFTGAVDVVLRFGRMENPPRPSIRKIEALSRFDETPGELIVELTDTGYVTLGDESAVAFAEARDALLDVLPDDDGLTVPEILAQTGGRRTTVQSALGSLIDAGDVERIGAGHRGDPHRYRRQPVEFLSAAPAPLRGDAGRSGGREETRGRRGPSVGERMAGVFASGDRR